MRNTAVAFAVLICLIFSVFPVFADDSGSVAAWDFDVVDDGVIYDTTGSGNNLKINTGDYVHEDGFSGKAVKFNPPYETNTSRHMLFDTDGIFSALNGASKFTFACMFKKLTNVSDLGEKDLLTVYFSGGKAAARIYLKENLIGISTRADSSEAGMSTVVAKIDIPGETDWYNLAVIFDYPAKKIYAYIDGGMYLDADMPGWTSETLNLDANNSKNGLGCDCAVIDNAAIYARALSEEEIISRVPAVLRLDMSNGANKAGGMRNLTIPPDAKNVPGINGIIKMQNSGEQFSVPDGALAKKLSEAKAKAVSAGMWVRGELPASQQTLFRIFGSLGVAALDIKIDQNGKIEYGGRSDNDTAEGREPYKSTSANVGWSSDKWHHIMCVTDYANNLRQIYFDGELAAQSEAGHRKAYYANGFSASKPELIGIKNMAVDDVIVFARALDNREIKDIINERNNTSVFVSGGEGGYFVKGQLSGSGTASAVVYNNQSLPQSGILIIALTDNNNYMKQIKKFTVTDLASGEECTFNTQFADMKYGDTIRLFYWDSLSGKNIISKFTEY